MTLVFYTAGIGWLRIDAQTCWNIYVSSNHELGNRIRWSFCFQQIKADTQIPNPLPFLFVTEWDFVDVLFESRHFPFKFREIIPTHEPNWIPDSQLSKSLNT